MILEIDHRSEEPIYLQLRKQIIIGTLKVNCSQMNSYRQSVNLRMN